MKLLNYALSLFLAATSPAHGAYRATFYSPKFEGKMMADGHLYHSTQVSAASNDFPVGSKIKVLNLSNGKGIYLTVTDRSRKHKGNKIDLSMAAFEALGLNKKRGWGWVTVTLA